MTYTVTVDGQELPAHNVKWQVMATDKQVAFGVALCEKIATLMPCPSATVRARSAYSYMSGLSKEAATEYITLLIKMRDELVKNQADAYANELLAQVAAQGTFSTAHITEHQTATEAYASIKSGLAALPTPVLPEKGYYLVSKDLGKAGHPGYTEVVTVTNVFKGSESLTAKRLWIGLNHKAKWVRDKSLRQMMGKHPEKVQKLTQDQAAQLGHLHGVCVICGRALTDPKSVQAGIGPVCSGKVSWAA